MINSRKLNIVAVFVIIVAVVASVFLPGILNAEGATEWKNTPEYAEKVFGTDIISVEILADEEDWQGMLDNARDEQFIMVDVIVNGVKFQNVGIRPKGNSSLTQVASNSDSDRYSFRLQFDEYINDQTCFGLQSLVLNNMTGDYTYMKEYISYDIMNVVGVNTPYYGFADIKLNGENIGFYLAIEMYNEGYELRTFGTTAGMLYNVKSMDMGNNNQQNQFEFNEEMLNQFNQSDRENVGFNNRRERGGEGEVPQEGEMTMPQEGEMTMPQEGERTMPQNGGMGGRGGGGDLAYTDDNSSSYSSIFSNAVGKSTEKDYARVIEALKALSENRDLEKYFDVDSILRYLAAHTVVVNLDSYTSSMAQNYYLYENNGQATILPWDYNFSWGGFQSSDISTVVNFPIDTPVSGVSMESRPLINILLSNEEYLERYHSYLQLIVDNYFADGKIETKINELDKLINEYVKNDPTAFNTYEQYTNAVASFTTIAKLRGESIQGQLNKTVPSTTEDQNANSNKLIATDALNLADLGGGMGGGMGMEGKRGMRGRENVAGNTMPAIPEGAENTMPAMPEGVEDMMPNMRGEINPNDTSTTQYLYYGIIVVVLVGGIIFAARLRRNY